MRRISSAAYFLIKIANYIKIWYALYALVIYLSFKERVLMPKEKKLDFNSKLLIAAAVLVAIMLCYICVDKVVDNKNVEAYEAKIVDLQQRIADLHKEYYLGSADFVFTTEPETSEPETETGITEDETGATEGETNTGDMEATTDAAANEDATQDDEAVNADVTVEATEADTSAEATGADTTEEPTEENTTEDVTEAASDNGDIPDIHNGHAV